MLTTKEETYCSTRIYPHTYYYRIISLRTLEEDLEGVNEGALGIMNESSDGYH
jgi:hypothetical protein